MNDTYSFSESNGTKRHFETFTAFSRTQQRPCGSTQRRYRQPLRTGNTASERTGKMLGNPGFHSIPVFRWGREGIILSEGLLRRQRLEGADRDAVQREDIVAV